jgi:hypothetical protein
MYLQEVISRKTFLNQFFVGVFKDDKKFINIYFSLFDQILQFTSPMKDVQVTGKTFSSQKRKSSTSKHEIS